MWQECENRHKDGFRSSVRSAGFVTRIGPLKWIPALSGDGKGVVYGGNCIVTILTFSVVALKVVTVKGMRKCYLKCEPLLVDFGPPLVQLINAVQCTCKLLFDC